MPMTIDLSGSLLRAVDLPKPLIPVSPATHERLGRAAGVKQIVRYCGHCRKVLKVEPRGSIERGCVCEVPRIGPPTTVWS